MDDSQTAGEGEAEREELLEELVARCIERGGDDVFAVADEIGREHPQLAVDLKARLERLAAVGMVAPSGAPGGSGTPIDLPDVEGHEVLSPLGAGGMAVVFAAREQASGDLVALKIAEASLAWNERARERFRREIDAARRLDHPHVIPIRAVGESHGVPFFTMELVAGATVGAMLDALRRTGIAVPDLRPEDVERAWADRRVRFGGDGELGAARPSFGATYVETATRIALEVAEALAHAHAHGVVHRDVKPGNVLIDAEGRARLFDLGLAHIADDPRLTRTGDFAGSPQYASPEQVTGGAGAVDERTDVHAVGVLLFELLTLRPPFQGRTTPELLRKIQREDAPALRQVAPFAPRDLETVVACCLEKNPKERYGTAEELAADLRRFLGFQPVHARAIGRAQRAARFARRNPAPTTAAVLAATILIASPLALWLHSLSIADQRDRATASAAEARREADENLEVSRFLESLIRELDQSPDPSHREAARELVVRARARLDAEEDIQPLTRASLFHTVARVLAGIGANGVPSGAVRTGRGLEAIPLLDRSLLIRHGELGETHAETVATLAELAGLHLALGDLGSARGLAERAVRAAEVGAIEGRPAAFAAEILGAVELASGAAGPARLRLEAAASAYGSLAADRAGSAASSDQARALRRLARARLQEGVSDESVDAARGYASLARELSHARWEPDLDALVDGEMLLADIAVAAESRDVAASHLVEALRLRRRQGESRGAETLALLERLVPMQEARSGGSGADVQAELFEELVLLGEMREASGPDADSRSAFQRAIGVLAAIEAGGDAVDPDLAGRAHLGLARTHLADGEPARARAELDAASAYQERTASAEPWIADRFALALRIAFAESDDARIDDEVRGARRWFEERVAGSVRPSRDLVTRLRSHALLLCEVGRAPDAEPMLAQADLVERRLDGADSDIRRPTLGGLADDLFDLSMQEGVTFLQSGRIEDAVRAFDTCRALRPDDPIASYNLACAHARLDQVDEAFAALERSVELGYAYRDRADELTRADPDLAPLRDDARFELVMRRMASLRAAADAYAAEAAVYVSPAARASASPPLLVVLHADGATKRAVVDGRWREVADALGAVLLAPSGRIPVGTDPARGMRWTDSLARYRARTWFYEKPVRDAVAELRRTRSIDPDRVFIAGEDLGGTVAFHLAVHAPEMFRGCVLVDAAVLLDLATDVTANLDALGLRAAMLADVTSRPPGMALESSVHEELAHTFRQLGEWGIDTTLATRSGGEASVERLVSAVRFLETGRRAE